jgi:hypothetical protein
VSIPLISYEKYLQKLNSTQHHQLLLKEGVYFKIPFDKIAKEIIHWTFEKGFHSFQ